MACALETTPQLDEETLLAEAVGVLQCIDELLYFAHHAMFDTLQKGRSEFNDVSREVDAFHIENIEAERVRADVVSQAREVLLDRMLDLSQYLAPYSRELQDMLARTIKLKQMRMELMSSMEIFMESLSESDNRRRFEVFMEDQLAWIKLGRLRDRLLESEDIKDETVDYWRTRVDLIGKKIQVMRLRKMSEIEDKLKLMSVGTEEEEGAVGYSGGVDNPLEQAPGPSRLMEE